MTYDSLKKSEAETMKKKIHKILFGRFFCFVGFKDASNSTDYGWKTACGEVLWPHWRGSTETKDVNCKRCIKVIGCAV